MEKTFLVISPMILKILILCSCITSCTGVSGQQPEHLKTTLKTTFPNQSVGNGKWVYFDDDPTLFKCFIIDSLNPDKQLYKVYLTNFLGHHVSSSPCIIIANKQLPIITLIEPFNYSGEIGELSKLIVGKKLPDSLTFIHLLAEMQSILAVGVNGYFDNLQLADSLVTFDYLIPRGRLRSLRRQFVVKYSNYTIKEIEFNKSEKINITASYIQN